MADKEFVDGMMFKAPKAGAPDFVKGSISIKRVNLIAWLSGKTDDWVNLQVKQSRAGKLYIEVDNWEKKANVSSGPAPEDDLPF